ncbi:MAG: SPOR domain-containing protein [Variibacter sp.]|nr:SPOR domain-containing protein [Variibacter sp.]
MAEDSKFRPSRAETISVSGAAAERLGRAGSSDPLAELARLIGQDDLFEQMRRDARADSRAPSAMPVSEQLEVESRRLARNIGRDETRGSRDQSPDFQRRARPEPPVTTYPDAEPAAPRAAAQADADAPTYVYEPHRADPHSEYPADYGPQDAYSDPYYADGTADPQADPAYAYGEEDMGPLPAERRRSGFATIGVVLGLAVLGTAAAFGYRAMVGGESGPPPVIKADTTPAKIVPAQKPDGQDTRVVYDRAEKPQVERLVSREEQPIEMKEAKPSAPRMLASSAGGAAGVAAPPQASAPAAPASGPQAAANPNEPKKVKTVAIRPDGSIIPESARAQPETGGTRGATASGTAAPRLPVARPATAGQTASHGPMAVAPQSEGARGGANAPAQSAPGRAAPVAAGMHVVQLASQKTEAEAEASFRALQAKYPTVLGGWQPLIRRVDLGSRGTYYRAQVGPFASIEEANELCSNLKAAGGQCIVQRN